MIRRLILCGPYSPEEAAAVTLMAEKMVGQSIAYRAAPVERRILMFQSSGISFFSNGKRRQSARLLDDAPGQALAVVNAAVVKGEPVLNVFTGNRIDTRTAYSGTDATFTIGLPEGTGVTYYSRVAGGGPPGIAVQCIVQAHGARTSPWFIPIHADWCILRDGVRFSFFKRKPIGWQRGRELAIEHARRVMTEALASYGL